jgi:hypothetical protein
MWDSIMNVGKTPQITSDMVTNPYFNGVDDISHLLFGYVAQLGNTTSFKGNINAVTNPNFFYDIAGGVYAVLFTCGNAGTDTILQFDIGRKLIIRGISLFYGENDGGVNVTVNLETSEDGANWVTQSSMLASGVNVGNTLTARDVIASKIRIRLSMPSGLGATYIYLNNLKVLMSRIQTF